MSLRLSYTLLAPFYDFFADPAFAGARRSSLAGLPATGQGAVLLNGVGSGLDLPYLPRGRRYIGIDCTGAMLARCRNRAKALDFAAVRGDSLSLPFAGSSFDHAILHLILAVVPDGVLALAETARVVRPGGTILILDKFLKPGQTAPIRRIASPLAARFVTRLDLVFEDVLRQVSGLRVISDEPAGAGGWFRRICLEKA
jgi:phosphatidylethanolamine/phosphatidyl-N-methylethanolamine N-methyltransferase